MVTEAEASRALVAFDYETITVSSSVVGLTASKIQPAGGRAALGAAITVEGATIRYRLDGGNPVVGSAGHLGYDTSVAPAQVIWVYGTENLRRFRAVREGASDATLRVTYYH